ADPEFADAAGFPKPILHGLCTYGMACYAVLKTLCDYDHTKIKAFDARFSSPVYPGETIVTDMWVDGTTASYRCRVKERDIGLPGGHEHDRIPFAVGVLDDPPVRALA
ncbi:MAG: MaoC/PaaZ C-terminal domain-containing protein, partial [Proteobacteria bacterium]|nr:MaoC/PaaZ C-terminal domain-containing protein [Pseudomonadota bacterium]